MSQLFVWVLIIFSSSFSNDLNWDHVKQDIDQKYPNTPTISISKLLQWQKKGLNISLIDVREPLEFETSHLKNSLLLTSVSEITETFLNKDTLLILYCSVGMRSAKLVQELSKQGYRQVYNLEGSIFEWANQHLPVYQSDSIIQKVHPYNKRWGKLLNSTYHP